MRSRDPLNIIELKAKRIKRIQFICNTILANCCYHQKEMEKQIMLAEKSGHLEQEEQEIICQAWSYRNTLAQELLSELKRYIGENKHETKNPHKKT